MPVERVKRPAPRYAERVLAVMSAQLPVVSGADDLGELAYRARVSPAQARRALRYLVDLGAVDVSADRGERTYVRPDSRRGA